VGSVSVAADIGSYQGSGVGVGAGVAEPFELGRQALAVLDQAVDRDLADAPTRQLLGIVLATHTGEQTEALPGAPPELLDRDFILIGRDQRRDECVQQLRSRDVVPLTRPAEGADQPGAHRQDRCRAGRRGGADHREAR
jgi:hypothetical protein